MGGVQRVIKWCALALAAVIIVSIISGIVGAGMIMGRVFDWQNGGVSAPSTAEIVEIGGGELSGEVREVYIKTGATNVKVVSGEELKIQGDEELIEVRRGGDALYIEEKDGAWMSNWWDRSGEVVVTLPKGKILQRFKLDAGAGKVELEEVATEILELELGAGRTDVVGVTATERAKVDGGAGVLVMRDSKLRNLDLDMGVGKVELGVLLSGDNTVEAGVGRLDLALEGGEENYQVKVEKGLGSIVIDGEEVGDGAVKGEGATVVEIEGGVGAIEVRF